MTIAFKTGYEWEKTVKKIVVDVLVYGTPVILTVGLGLLGDWKDITLGGLLGVFLKGLVDYLKHS